MEIQHQAQPSSNYLWLKVSVWKKSTKSWVGCPIEFITALERQMQKDRNVKTSMDNTNSYLADWAMQQDAVNKKVK